MHVVFRESHGLEETETPTDLGQDPADLVVLSYSDSDLGAFAAGWRRANGALPAPRVPWERPLRGLLARAVADGPRRSFRRPAGNWVAAEALARQTGGPVPVSIAERPAKSDRGRVVEIIAQILQVLKR